MTKEYANKDHEALKSLPSLFIVSLPRSLSGIIYHAASRATGLRAPTWTSDGEILNLDRHILQPMLMDDASRKFTTEERDSKAFQALLEFLDHVFENNGWAYKDVVQPFVIAQWIRRTRVHAIRIKRSIAEVACSMLNRRWHYPIQLFREEQTLELAMIKGLVLAERALDSVPAIQLDFDQLIANERPLQSALVTMYGNEIALGAVKYMDPHFQNVRTTILNRRRTRTHRRLERIVSEMIEEVRLPQIPDVS